MAIPGKETVSRLINYHSVSGNRLRRYMDEMRRGVAAFPANEFNKKAMNELVAMLDREVPESISGGTILDVGCGDGYTLSRINEKYSNKNLLGVSVCRGDIDLAKKLHSIAVRFGDMNDLPCKKNSVDTIITRHCLEHSPMPLFSLMEMYRVMRPGSGVLAVVLPANTPYWIEFDGHFHCMPKENWLCLFEIAGFEVVYQESGSWFARATNSDELEWRFILRPIADEKYSRAYRGFYRDWIGEFIQNIRRSFTSH